MKPLLLRPTGAPQSNRDTAFGQPRLRTGAGRTISAAVNEIAVTSVVFGLGLMAVGAVAFVERRPRKDLMPGILPTTPFLFAGMIVALLALVHLVNLWGVHTGR